MGPRRGHPFAGRWNHNTHYYPLLVSLVPSSAGRVLDVGCGDGTFARYLAQASRVVVGADADASLLASASALRLPFADATFGAVTMVMVLHHVEAERAIDEAVRVLAPGGALLILGYARSDGLCDLPHRVRDFLAHQLISRGKQAWEPPTVKADPAGTWSEARALADRALPGGSYRRLVMWRYLVEWHKPAHPTTTLTPNP